MQISCQHGGVLALGIVVRIITLLCVYVLYVCVSAYADCEDGPCGREQVKKIRRS